MYVKSLEIELALINWLNYCLLNWAEKKKEKLTFV